MYAAYGGKHNFMKNDLCASSFEVRPFLVFPEREVMLVREQELVENDNNSGKKPLHQKRNPLYVC